MRTDRLAIAVVCHRNVRLTVHGRLLLVERVRSGRPVAHGAAGMGISRATAHKGSAAGGRRASRGCRTAPVVR